MPLRRWMLLITLFCSVFSSRTCPAVQSDWKELPVEHISGRFGQFMEGYRYRKLGYLTLISDGADVYSISMGRNVSLGRPNLPPAYSYAESFGWTGARKVWRWGADSLVVHESLLAPGFLYESSSSAFRWAWEEKSKARGFVLPLAGGARYFGEGEPYKAELHGPLAANWLLMTFNGSGAPVDCPLLFVFEKSPTVMQVTTHEFIDLRFDGPAGKIVILPLYGVRKYDFTLSAAWRKAVPDEVTAACNGLAARCAHYPVDCRVRYHLDGDSLRVREAFSFISFEGATQPRLAPIAPFVRLAQQDGYPVGMSGKLVEGGYPTHYGPLDWVEGEVAEYCLPLCPYVDKTVMPVALSGVPGQQKVEKRLAEYLAAPNLLWPGDEDYHPDDLMDTLHNLRLLAWAAWSLPSKQRGLALEELARPGLERVAQTPFYRYIDPVAGRSYLRDSTVFAVRGPVSYDADWYNGFELAGVWAWRQFGDRAEGLDLARRHWALWTGLRDYYEIYHDWAVCASLSDPRGNLLDFDCMRNGWCGLIAYARLARELGETDLYERTMFLVSRMQLAHYAQWSLGGYLYDQAATYAPDSGTGLLAWPRADILCVEALDSYGPHQIMLPDDDSPYCLSANIPEHALFLEDFGLTPRLHHLVYDLVPKYQSGWNTFDPSKFKTLYGDDTDAWWRANAAAGRYFYFLDPLLFSRAMNFHEPLERLLGHRRLDWLSGQAVEAMLVGSRPELVAPVNAEFRGNRWDEKAQSLEFSLEGRGPAQIEIRNCGCPKKVEPKAAVDYDPGRRIAFLSLELRGLQKTRVWF